MSECRGGNEVCGLNNQRIAIPKADGVATPLAHIPAGSGGAERNDSSTVHPLIVDDHMVTGLDDLH
ncbi:MAG: hypothetical protein PsegKO_33540 [Pseudohongiellaceae bacterium]